LPSETIENRMVHDGMPYDPIQGKGQGYDCLKATQEESSISPIIFL